jgi:hypothetical protein
MSRTIIQIYDANNRGTIVSFLEQFVLMMTGKNNYEFLKCNQNYTKKKKYDYSFLDRIKPVLSFIGRTALTGVARCCILTLKNYQPLLET